MPHDSRPRPSISRRLFLGGSAATLSAAPAMATSALPCAISAAAIAAASSPDAQPVDTVTRRASSFRLFTTPLPTMWGMLCTAIHDAGGFSRILAVEHARLQVLPRGADRRVFEDTAVTIYRAG